MATNFPASLDTLTNPTSSDSLSSPSHSAQHANVNDAVEALQAKVGADSSAVVSSHDYKIAQLEAISHGKILQVVRASDSTERSTTSTSYTDVTGMSVTITPTSATSEVIVIATGYVTTASNSFPYVRVQLTDSSNSTMFGAEEAKWGAGTVASENGIVVIGHDSPATTSAVTYKVRFRSEGGQTVRFRNNVQAGQLFAIEVGA